MLPLPQQSSDEVGLRPGGGTINRRTLALSFIAACTLCAFVLAAVAIAFPHPSSLTLWLTTLLLTYLVSAYQRRTGPGYDIPASCTVNATRIGARLPTSYSGDGDCAVRLSPALEGPAPLLVYRRYPTSEAWIQTPFTPTDSGMVAYVPHQPAAGKVEYHVELADPDAHAALPKNDNVIVRFRGPASPAILLPHVLLMLAGMVLSLRTGLEAWHGGPLQEPLAWFTLAALVGGAMVFGPLVQKAAFGRYWTGIPLGHDLTDNKMLVVVFVWIIAVVGSVAAWRSAPEIRLAASGISLVAFLIPHSLFGSEFRYEDQSPAGPAKEAE